ncbi:unnamed protein product [Cunninghamella blakesleeana]
MLERIKKKLSQLKNKNSTLFGQSERESLLGGHHDNRIIEGQEPIDNCNIVYWIFFLYGIAMLLPWNVFITASEYFATRFSGSIYEETFQSYFSTYFTITNMLCYLYILWRQSKLTSSKGAIDVFYPVLLNTLIFGTMSMTVEFDIGGTDYFWFTLILLIITGATTSFFQIAVMAEASQFPPQYIQAVMSGQGIAGVAVALSSILSALAANPEKTHDDNSTNQSAFLYFMSALIVSGAALIGRVILSQQPFYKYQLQQEKTIMVTDNDEEEGEAQQQESIMNDPSHTSSLSYLIKNSYGLIFAVGYVFCITLMVFPTVTSLIKSVVRHPPMDLQKLLDSGIPSRFFDDDIFIAFHFLLFNIGDWVGRFLPLWSFFRTFQTSHLVILSLLRTFFIPLFLVCNVVISSTTRSLPCLIQSDFGYMFINLVFSISNGWLGSLSMMAAPQQSFIHTGTQKAKMGTIMSFSLVVGLAIGGTLSFWVRSFI